MGSIQFGLLIIITVVVAPILRLLLYWKSDPILPTAFRILAEFVLAPVFIVQKLVTLVSQKYLIGLQNTKSFQNSKKIRDEEYDKWENVFMLELDIHSELFTWSLTVDSMVAFIHLFYLNTESFLNDVQSHPQLEQKMEYCPAILQITSPKLCGLIGIIFIYLSLALALISLFLNYITYEDLKHKYIYKRGTSSFRKFLTGLCIG